MSYASLMVHLEVGRSNAGVLAVAAELAERFHSRVVGIATGRPVIYPCGDGYISGDQLEQDIADREKKIGAVESEFHASFLKRNTAVEWRSYVGFGPAVDHLALQSRCADLILTGASDKSASHGTGSFDAGALVLEAGRPVLVVPSSAKEMKLDKAAICWRDTREARRAVVDAMDLLKQVRAVDVIEVTTDDEMPACRSRLQDVVAWLALHGVDAMPVATAADGDEKTSLASIIEEREADFIVAGAYGHTRLREWVLGGVTRDLWMESNHCSLLSH